MNYRMILSLLGDVLLVIGAFLLLPCIVAVIYGEPELWVLLATAAGSGLLGGLLSCCGRSAAVSCTRVTAS